MEQEARSVLESLLPFVLLIVLSVTMIIYISLPNKSILVLFTIQAFIYL